jgi:hypothetical protein
MPVFGGLPFSINLPKQDVSDMGLYESSLSAGFSGFHIGMMMAVYHSGGTNWD